MSDDQFTILFKEIKKLDARMENMATRDDIAELRDEMQTGFDQIAS